MNHFAVLLNGPIDHDYRVQKTVLTLSKLGRVDVFCEASSNSNFNFNSEFITLRTYIKPQHVYAKLLRHSLFCKEYNFLVDLVLKTNLSYSHIWANDLPTLLPARIVAKKKAIHLIYDSHEIYLETINQFFPRKSSFLKNIVFSFLKSVMRFHGRKVERRILIETNLFITVNESLLNYFQSLYRFQKGIVIMNQPNLQKGNDEVKDLRAMFAWSEEDIILLYQGILNEGRGLFHLVESMLYLPEKYKLLIIGDGTLFHKLSEEVKSKQLQKRIRFTGMIDLQNLPSYTSGGDIGINLLESFNLSKQLASPNKLFEYIHAGIPILATNTIENKRIIESYNLGILCENDSKSITSSIIQNDFNKIKESALFELAQKECNWENQELTLISAINETSSNLSI